MVFFVPTGWKDRKLKRRFHELAEYIVENCEGSEEVTVGLRKMLEARECFIRARWTKRIQEGHENELDYEPSLVEP